MELDQIMFIVGRFLIAVILIVALFKGVQLVVPSWFDNTLGTSLNGIVGQIPIP